MLCIVLAAPSVARIVLASSKGVVLFDVVSKHLRGAVLSLYEAFIWPFLRFVERVHPRFGVAIVKWGFRASGG